MTVYHFKRHLLIDNVCYQFDITFAISMFPYESELKYPVHAAHFESIFFYSWISVGTLSNINNIWTVAIMLLKCFKMSYLLDLYLKWNKCIFEIWRKKKSSNVIQYSNRKQIFYLRNILGTTLRCSENVGMSLGGAIG